jgi:peptidoglycan hydrolase CwlO-like protein
MSNNDQKDAVGHAIHLSSQLITAALAILAILGAYVAFALGNRLVGFGFYSASAISFIVFILSIFLAGRGIATSYSKGAKGDWNVIHGDHLFNSQAILCAIGLIAFFAAVLFSITPAPSATQDKLQSIDNRIAELSGEIKKMNGHAEKYNQKIDTLNGNFKKFDTLNKNLDKIELEIKSLSKAVVSLKCEKPQEK